MIDYHDHELAAPSSSARRVLLVEDDPLVRALTGAMLNSQGWQVFNAGSADEAARLFGFCRRRRIPLSAVLLDMVLPGGMTGLETLAVLRSLDPTIPVIATSGYFEVDAIKRCLAAGFNDVLAKPYSSRQLCETVDRLARTGEGPVNSAWDRFP